MVPLSSLITITHEEGVRALWKGFVPKVLQLTPGRGILLRSVTETDWAPGIGQPPGQQLRQGKSSLLSLSPLLGFLPVLKAASSSPTTRPCQLCPCTHPAARRRDCCQWKYQVPVQMQSSLP